jgi:hypothetical protein
MSYIVLDLKYVEMFTGLLIAHWRERERERGGGRGQVVISAHAGWVKNQACCEGRYPAPMQWLLRKGRGELLVISCTARNYPHHGD